MSKAVERRSLVLRSGRDLCLLALLEDHVAYGYEHQPAGGARSAGRRRVVLPAAGPVGAAGLVGAELRPPTAGPARGSSTITDGGASAPAAGDDLEQRAGLP